jgi:hypothetical protein
LARGSGNRALRRAERRAIDAVLIGLGSSKTRQAARTHTSVLRALGRATATLAHLPMSARMLTPASTTMCTSAGAAHAADGSTRASDRGIYQHSLRRLGLR